MPSTNEFHTQNQYVQNLKDKYSTSDKKTIYLNEQISSLIDINKWLFWIFIIAAIFFSIFCFISPKMNNWSIKQKIILIIAVALYPFYIYYIEKYAYRSFVYIKSMVIGNVYVSPDF